MCYRIYYSLFFSGHKAKISNLTITLTAVVFSHILNMKRSFLHTRSFRPIHFSVFRYRWTKTGFTGPKSFRGFRETGPGTIVSRETTASRDKEHHISAGNSQKLRRASHDGAKHAETRTNEAWTRS